MKRQVWGMAWKGMVLGAVIALGVVSQAADQPSGKKESEPKVKYKSSKDVDFEALLVNGQLRRPEVMVVTGNPESDGNGLLKLREDFLDRTSEDFGEEAQ